MVIPPPAGGALPLTRAESSEAKGGNRPIDRPDARTITATGRSVGRRRHAATDAPDEGQRRTHRGLSQLSLAARVGSTGRHISFPETGRSRPSRQTLLRLADTLGIGRRDANELLYAAGDGKESRRGCRERRRPLRLRHDARTAGAAKRRNPA
ncbi:helix-turn-helix transcriptional regulator [Dactylosporangium sp. NPDC049140]|uniref:helix-turn-helix transcriptional regulator n=1 Tax=Dactylosporangium sp. NPDC049140 TaxID=3155647 RepID=UPI0033F9CCEE